MQKPATVVPASPPPTTSKTKIETKSANEDTIKVKKSSNSVSDKALQSSTNSKSVSEETIKKSNVATEIQLDEFYHLKVAVDSRKISKIVDRLLACEGVPTLFLAELFTQCEDTYVEWESIHKQLIPEDAELPPTLAEFVKRARRKQPYQNWDELVSYVLQMPPFLLNICLGAMLKDRSKCSPYRTKDLLMRLALIAFLLYGGMLRVNPKPQQRTHTEQSLVEEANLNDDIADGASDDYVNCLDYAKEYDAINQNTPIIIKSEPVDTETEVLEPPGKAAFEQSHLISAATIASVDVHPKTLQSNLRKIPVSAEKSDTTNPSHASPKREAQALLSRSKVKVLNVSPDNGVHVSQKKIKESDVKSASSISTNADADNLLRLVSEPLKSEQSSANVQAIEAVKVKKAVTNQSSRIELQENMLQMNSFVEDFTQSSDQTEVVCEEPFKMESKGNAQKSVTSHMEESSNVDEIPILSSDHLTVDNEYPYVYHEYQDPSIPLYLNQSQAIQCPLCTYVTFAKKDAREKLERVLRDHVLTKHCDDATKKPYEETLLLILANQLYVNNQRYEGGILQAQVFTCPNCFQIDVIRKDHYIHILSHAHQKNHLGCLPCTKWFDSHEDLFDHFVTEHNIAWEELPTPDSLKIILPEVKEKIHERIVARAKLTTSYIQLYVQMEKRHPGLLPSLDEVIAARKGWPGGVNIASLLSEFFINAVTLYPCSKGGDEDEKPIATYQLAATDALIMKPHQLSRKEPTDKSAPVMNHRSTVKITRENATSKEKEVGDERIKMAESHEISMSCPFCKFTVRADRPNNRGHLKGPLIHHIRLVHCEKNTGKVYEETLQIIKAKNMWIDNPCASQKHITLFTCPFCLRLETSRLCYYTHVRSHPGQDQHLMCFVCTTGYNTYADLFAHYEQKHNVKCEGDPSPYHFSSPVQVKIDGDSNNEPAKALFTSMYKRVYAEMEQKHPGVLEPLSSLELSEPEGDTPDSVVHDREWVKNCLALFEEVELEIANFLSLYQCHYCGVPFTTSADRLDHENQMHKKEVAEHQSIFDGSKKNLFGEMVTQCHFCQYPFETAIDRDDHEKENHQSEAIEKILLEYNVTEYGWIRLGYARLLKRCTICSFFTTTESVLEEHMKEKHSDNTYYMCHKCGRVFTGPGKRKRHQSACVNHVKKEEIPCSKCGEKFYSKHLLSVHQKFINCTGEPDFKPADAADYPECFPDEDIGAPWLADHPDTWICYCHYCEKQFKGTDVRDRHEEEHHGEEIAAKRLRKKQLMDQLTVRRLKKENQWSVEEWVAHGYEHLLQSCFECDFRTISLHELRCHQSKMHGQPASLPAKTTSALCEKCGKVFKQANQLKKHTLMTNCTNNPNFVPVKRSSYKKKLEKFPCEKCGKMILERNLKHHNNMVNCTNDPDFVISEECKEKFKRHKCKKCGRRYYKKQQLLRHNAKVNCDNSEDFKPKFFPVKRKVKSPVECKKCGKVLANKSQLQRHHAEVNCTNDPNFVRVAPPSTCKRCGKVFHTKGSWRLHTAVVNCTKDPNFKVPPNYKWALKKRYRKYGTATTKEISIVPEVVSSSKEDSKSGSENEMHSEEKEYEKQSDNIEYETHSEYGEYKVPDDGVYSCHDDGIEYDTMHNEEDEGQPIPIPTEDLVFNEIQQGNQMGSSDHGIEVISQEGILYAQDDQNPALEPVFVTHHTVQANSTTSKLSRDYSQMGVSSRADEIPTKFVDIIPLKRLIQSKIATPVKPIQLMQNTHNSQDQTLGSCPVKALNNTGSVGVAMNPEVCATSVVQNKEESKNTVQNIGATSSMEKQGPRIAEQIKVEARNLVQKVEAKSTVQTVIGAKGTVQNIVGAKSTVQNVVGPVSAMQNFATASSVARTKCTVQEIVETPSVMQNMLGHGNTVQNIVESSSAVGNAVQPIPAKYTPVKITGKSNLVEFRKHNLPPKTVKTKVLINPSPQTQSTQFGIETMGFARVPKQVEGIVSLNENTSVDIVGTKKTENVDSVKCEQNLDNAEYKDNVGGQSTEEFKESENTVGYTGPPVIEGVGEVATGQQCIALVDASGEGIDNEEFQQILTTVLQDGATGDMVVYLQ